MAGQAAARRPRSSAPPTPLAPHTSPPGLRRPLPTRGLRPGPGGLRRVSRAPQDDAGDSAGLAGLLARRPAPFPGGRGRLRPPLVPRPRRVFAECLFLR